MSSRRPVRLAVFTTHPIQYQVPLFRELAAHPELEPTVFFGSRHGAVPALDRDFGRVIQWDRPLLDGYRHVFLSDQTNPQGINRFLDVRAPGIARHWTRDRFDVAIVFGWQTLGHFAAIRAATRAGIPVLLRGDSHLGMRLHQGMKAVVHERIWQPARRGLYRRLFARMDGLLVVGARNADYYRHFGVPDAKLHWSPHSVDNAHFALAPAAHADARRAVRATLGIPADAVVFACVAKLVANKRPGDFVAALARVAAAEPAAHLLLVGDGAEREAVLAAAAAAGIADRVHVSGFVNQQDIPRYYAAADVLVLGSASETWGLVVNEGMAAGLPAILSDTIGSAPDLVREGETGYVYPCGDVEALAGRMRTMLAAGSAGRAAMGARARRLIADYSFPVVADRLVETLQALVRR